METKLNYENRTEKTPTYSPLICCSVRENISSADLKNKRNPLDNPKFYFHVGSGNNKNYSNASMSCNERVFVISYWNKPLTPCKKGKARKLLLGGVAKVVWNKFGQFGIHLLVPTRQEKPKTVLGIDFGTKFEGVTVVTKEQNNFNVMWLLPNKKMIVRKLDERRILRRARRQRNCRRRQARFDNRSRKNFIAPSQKVLVDSRLKYIKEIFNCYPISKVAIEDVKFNHRDNRWGKNFTTIEIGKNMIYDYMSKKLGGRDNIILFEGWETQNLREETGLKKSSNKSAEHFNSHCVDAFVLAERTLNDNVCSLNENIIVVDDTYRPTRRRLHDTQFSKGGIRYKYSEGNFKGIRKGSICEFGQVVGGTKNTVWIRNSDNKRIGRSINKIDWYSKKFKVKSEGLNSAIPPTTEVMGILASNNFS